MSEVPAVLEIRTIHLDLLDAAPWNPMEESQKSLDNLAENIRQSGFSEPLLVTPLENGRYRIISGHDRAKAARLVGIKEVPCSIAEGLDEEMQKLQTVRMNVIRKKLSPGKFLKLYNEMAAKYSEEVVKARMMFTDETEMERAIATARKALPGELKSGFDKKKKQIKTTDDLATVISELFTRCGSQLERGYAIFSWGGQTHFYISMSEELRDVIQRFADRSEVENRHINEYFEEALGIARPK